MTVLGILKRLLMHTMLAAPLSQLPSSDFYERYAKSGCSVLLGRRFD